jgi:nucleotide-binding universal stress UspA family protein
MFNRILLALDGSPLAEQAVPVATVVARAFSSEVILLRVAEARNRASGRSLDSFDWRVERVEAIEYLRRIKAGLSAEGLDVDIDVTSGRACEEIVEVAQVRDVDLIIIGSHGWGGVSRFRMAGTAQKVLFGSDRSVLVVPSSEGELRPAVFDSVLVPVDGSAHGDWAACVGGRLAKSTGSELVVLQVIRTPHLLKPLGTKEEEELVEGLVSLNRLAAQRHLTDLVRQLDLPESTVSTRIVVGQEVTQLLAQQADQLRRPLVVLSAYGTGSGGRTAVAGLDATILTQSRHPILALRGARRTSRNVSRWSRRSLPSGRTAVSRSA